MSVVSPVGVAGGVARPVGLLGGGDGAVMAVRAGLAGSLASGPEERSVSSAGRLADGLAARST
ncbi:hypothetical protein J7F01_38745 [Streptomyces sp. ISL-22]|uniref:Uncharacterized protein n=1 Tax=Streptomyces curacoi TaxID=146536 RepID=A0A124GWL8_9ACTN|nr:MULTISPECIES: hypothetical protein [Streptomyces]KUM70037.1 hypothetical protein AQI70_30870 [Streptomyces curacoi]MBT2420529.1 hypothetical protein [Streptomyces sp. ISL-24]MBT2437968.1 hypothetical protein [Streptomyces sp. ISL-22]